MFTSCFLMRCSSRSSGPSKLTFSSRMGSDSSADSKSSGWVMSAVRDLHCVAHASHGLHGNRARARRTVEEDVAQGSRLREELGALLAERIEVGVQGIRQLRLHLDVADLPGAVAR